MSGLPCSAIARSRRLRPPVHDILDPLKDRIPATPLIEPSQHPKRSAIGPRVNKTPCSALVRTAAAGECSGCRLACLRRRTRLSQLQPFSR